MLKIELFLFIGNGTAAFSYRIPDDTINFPLQSVWRLIVGLTIGLFLIFLSLN